MASAFDLQRFLDAQAGAYDDALAELRAGRKRGHWICFIFPQLRGLGSSPSSQHYGIGGVEEAAAYAAHPVLGSRLRECANAVLQSSAPDAAALLGELDALKLRSSMTLFALAAPAEPIFRQVLDRWFGGSRDPLTLQFLAQPPGA